MVQRNGQEQVSGRDRGGEILYREWQAVCQEAIVQEAQIGVLHDFSEEMSLDWGFKVWIGLW